jgi:hypothetical protein
LLGPGLFRIVWTALQLAFHQLPVSVDLEPPYLNIHADAVGLKVFQHGNILGDLILCFLASNASIKNYICDGPNNFGIIAEYYGKLPSPLKGTGFQQP